MNFTFLTNLILAGSICQSAVAMEIKYRAAGSGAGRMEQWPSAIELKGPVEWGDDKKLKDILSKHSDVEEIEVGESPGGSLHAGIFIAKVIHDSGLPLNIKGPAASAATVISLGAKNQFTFTEDSKGFKETQLLFHCAYISDESVCDGRATKILSETLASFTRRTADDWYQFLMEKTSPDTVEPIRLFSLINESWNCASEDLRGTTCFRVNEGNKAGQMVAPGTYEVIEASRETFQEALDYVASVDVKDKTGFRIFESSNGWFAISRQAQNSKFCSDSIEESKENGLGYYPPDAFCSSGRNFIKKYNGTTGETIPTTDIDALPVFRVKLGATLDGYKLLLASPDARADVIAKIYEGDRFFVDLTGGVWWKVRDQASKRSGWINAGTDVEYIYR